MDLAGCPELAPYLAAVYYGDIDVDCEYNDPREFFQRTFLAEGLRHLPTNALLCLSGSGGNPVVDLQTIFDGGTTESMLALHHLSLDSLASELADEGPILDELAMDKILS